jgi:hypothetical protein
MFPVTAKYLLCLQAVTRKGKGISSGSGPIPCCPRSRTCLLHEDAHTLHRGQTYESIRKLHLCSIATGGTLPHGDASLGKVLFLYRTCQKACTVALNHSWTVTRVCICVGTFSFFRVSRQKTALQSLFGPLVKPANNLHVHHNQSRSVCGESHYTLAA